ncbi:MAG TPA: hypothetical protein PK992_20205 [Planctomycetaceae bacterium]|nr:hypothetical protein [Planctomycetaceae bacterium]HRA90425.1 hypothetical protein [Planctomycetaceae bacterium]
MSTIGAGAPLGLASQTAYFPRFATQRQSQSLPEFISGHQMRRMLRPGFCGADAIGAWA